MKVYSRREHYAHSPTLTYLGKLVFKGWYGTDQGDRIIVRRRIERAVKKMLKPFQLMFKRTLVDIQTTDNVKQSNLPFVVSFEVAALPFDLKLAPSKFWWKGKVEDIADEINGELGRYFQ